MCVCVRVFCVRDFGDKGYLLQEVKLKQSFQIAAATNTLRCKKKYIYIYNLKEEKLRKGVCTVAKELCNETTF